MLNKNKLAELIVTFFYIGKIKYCPGTIGSLIAFPICYFIMYLTAVYKITFTFLNLPLNEQILLTLFLICIIALIIIFAIGTYFTSIYIKYVGIDDPKEVIIDEILGQMLVITLCSFSVLLVNYSKLAEQIDSQTINIIFLWLIPFTLFRLFDILKPWPINWVDKNIKSGIGVMLDDVLAAVFATVIHYAIIFKIIDWYT